MQNCVPIAKMKASLRLIDDAVVLTSGDPLMEDWEAVVPKGSMADLKLRKALAPHNENKAILDLVEDFLASEASSTSYPSGLVFGTKSFTGSNSTIGIGIHQGGTTPVHYGLSLRGTDIISIRGAKGSGRTTFTRQFFPNDVTSFIDFATVDFDQLSPSARKEYGHSIALSFQRNPNLRYLVLDHYSQSTSLKRKHHPAFYHDMMEQILGNARIFAQLGKTLILAEGHPERIINRVVDMTGNGDYGFCIGGIEFPALPMLKPRRPRLAPRG